MEPTLNRVSRADTSARLEPKVMELLLCLARHAGAVVPKRLIIDTVWQTGFVADSTLTHAIAELRSVFGDDARAPRYIETITKRGYRLVAEVEDLDAHDWPPASGHLDCALVLEGQQIVLGRGENLVGRASDVAIRVDSDEVSRHHARVVVGSDGATLEDLASKNGTFLWASRLASPAPLEDGDEIAIGPALFAFKVLRTTATTLTAGSEDEDDRSG